MLRRKKHKNSGLWVFYVECYLDIRNRLLGTCKVKALRRGKGGLGLNSGAIGVLFGGRKGPTEACQG